ncbi:hypothetical protein BDA99DRAFT_495494 [Phascolomyces articulosus]|uniref:Uncharacterized protein n=1 Tax=Phascolomyces articulosus TaxID=60185 RepID=A0AAD5KM60_9FUNG|nr:hypothetical protein BDA99DRAFT_495494 [Phascolomyces articulosus]
MGAQQSHLLKSTTTSSNESETFVLSKKKSSAAHHRNHHRHGNIVNKTSSGSNSNGHNSANRDDKSMTTTAGPNNNRSNSCGNNSKRVDSRGSTPSSDGTGGTRRQQQQESTHQQQKQNRRPMRLYTNVQEASYRLVKRHLKEKRISELLPASTCPTSEQLLGFSSISTLDKRTSYYSTNTVSSNESITSALFSVVAGTSSASSSSEIITPISSLSSCHSKHGHETPTRATTPPTIITTTTHRSSDLSTTSPSDENGSKDNNTIYVGGSTTLSSNDLQPTSSQDSDVRRSPSLVYPNHSSSCTTETEIYYSSLVNNASTKLARVWVAQCKVHGFFGTDPQIDEGFQDLLKLAKQTPSPTFEAFAPLAVCYDYGLTPNRQSDPQRAFKWYKKATTAAAAAAMMLTKTGDSGVLLKNNNGQGVGSNNNSSTDASTTRMIAFAYYRMGVLSSSLWSQSTDALKYFHLSAVQGSPMGQYMLGLYYHYGIAVKQASLSHAKKWYITSAEQGNPDAQTALGLLLIDHVNDEQEKGVKWLELAAEQNNARALLRLGSFYEEAKDDLRAMEYYQRAASTATSDRDLALAHYLVGINYRMGDLGVSMDASRAIQHLTVSANGGYAPAQRALGLMYAQGIGIPKNDVKAHQLYQKAAAQGDIRAIGLLAEQNEHGRGCIMDLKNALQLYEKAASSGSVAAQLSLAELLQRIDHRAQAFSWFEKVANTSLSPSSSSNDNTSDFNIELIQQRNTARLMVARYRLQGLGGVEKKIAWAFHELITLADCDHFVDAYYWVAACYEEGAFVQRNIRKAFEYYEKAALHGDIDGQFQIALMLSNGVSEQNVVLIRRNHAKAFEWYTKAADAGHKTAQYSLGLYYAKALEPVEKVDTKKASHLFERAASQGLVVAMVQLAKLMLSSDSGQEQEALYWLRRAASQGDPSGMREMAAAYESGVAASFIKDSNKNNITNMRAIALGLLKKAAEEKNDALSWCAMARYYENGWSVLVDIPEAIRCYTQAESLGYTKAGLALADMYERRSMWQEALDKYDQMANENELLSPVGWKSRLAKGRLVIFQRKGTDDDMRTVYTWLHDMVEQDKGVVEPFEMLGACCEYGRGTSKDISSAITWYEMAVTQSSNSTQEDKSDIDWIKERARFHLGALYFEQKQHTVALKQFQSIIPLLKKMNHHSAETRQNARKTRYYLGYLLLKGDKVTHEIEQAKKWLSQAADEGEGAAAYELGMWILAHEEDEAEAKKRFDQGVSAGHAGCMRQFALTLEREQRYDLTWDGLDTVEWLDYAARLGDIEALVHLGLAYELGLGTTIARGQMEKALPLYIAAAQQNNVRAMIKAGETFSKMGRHCEAVSWLKKAEPHSLTARTMIASYHLQGRGGLQQGGGFKLLQSIIQEQKQDEHDDGVTIIHGEQDKNGISLAMFLLGQCYELGHETQQDLQQAEAWYHRAVDINEHTDAAYRIGILKSMQGDDTGALEWYRRAAEKGRHREAQYQVGMFHKDGRGGLEANLTVARNYFVRASDQEHPRAKYELAHIFWRKQKYPLALSLYKEAAQLMVPEALRELGNLYHQGVAKIEPRDYVKAFKCFCDAAQLGDATAALMVGSYFEEGYLEQQPDSPAIGIDREQALQWYETAYRLGCGSLAELAIGNLKHIMAEELGPELYEEAEDLREEAFDWFSEVAMEFKEETQYANIMVALYHIHGWGRIPIDQHEGFRLLRQVADAGGAQAFAEVARCYEEGIGVERDTVQALTFWEMAAEAQQDIGAMMRAAEIHEKGLAGQMNPQKASHYHIRAKAIASSQRSPSEITPSSSSSSSSYSLSTRSSVTSLRNSRPFH